MVSSISELSQTEPSLDASDDKQTRPGSSLWLMVSEPEPALLSFNTLFSAVFHQCQMEESRDDNK